MAKSSTLGPPLVHMDWRWGTRADAPGGMRWRQVEWTEDPTKKRKLPVLKLFLTATFIIPALLATLTGCSDTTPAPEEVPTPTQVSSRPVAPTSTDAPVSTQVPTERPTAGPTATPASPPTLEPKATPVPPGVLSPLQALDSTALLSELSDTELACIGDNPEELARSPPGLARHPGKNRPSSSGVSPTRPWQESFSLGSYPAQNRSAKKLRTASGQVSQS